MKLTNQQKGSLLAFIAVFLITPDSLFIRLSHIDTWGLLFYRGAIPFVVVFVGLLMVYRTTFFKLFFADLIITAPTAKPVAQINPKKFPKTSPLSKESLKM